tara:strand:+ start:773 stop:1732 length:960 start_codon:yes stop_codon:yes gene_type:complete
MMKILYIDGGHVLHENHMYPYYGGVYRELLNLASVTTYQGFVGNINSFLSYLDQDFDCIIFGLGYFANGSINWYSKIEGLSELTIPTVAMLHKPQNMLNEKLEFCRINKIKILVDPDITYKKYAARAGALPFRTWYTADPTIFHPRDIQKKYDIGFSGALHGGGKLKGPAKDVRPRVGELLQSNKSYKIFWNGSDSVSPRITNIEEYATKINESKAWLSTSGPLGILGPRYFEIMMSKTLLVCNEMPLQYEGVFVDGENCLIFKNDLSDLGGKLDYYLSHEEERKKIIERAYTLATNHFTWKHMALKLIDKIQEVADGR